MRHLSRMIATICGLSFPVIEINRSSATDVEVRLNDGRTVRGTVLKNETSEQQLVLEHRDSGITIRRTLTWKQIADTRVLLNVNRAIVIREVTQPERPEPAPNPRPSEPLPLSQLLVDASLISTTGKIDWDSLRLKLRGEDIHGKSVPLFGTLNVNLSGQRCVLPESNSVRHPFVTSANYGSRFLAAPSNSSAYQHPYVTTLNPTVEIARWTQAIDKDDCQTLVLRLPSPLPEHDIRVGAFGEVSVELLMPGTGVFEASTQSLLLSHQSVLRRERLNEDGSRFFSNESTSDSPQTTRSRNRFTWPGGVLGPERGILPIQP